MAMVPEVKSLLLDALKSGKYQKTVGRLAHVEDDGSVGYCCLGVLTDLAAKKGICNPFQQTNPKEADSLAVQYESVNDYGEAYEGFSSCYLTPDVQGWSGINSREQDDLASLNDNNNTFAGVIEYIETNL